MSLKDYRQDVSTSITPILGPLSGGSWMTLSPVAAFRAFLGGEPQPKKPRTKYSTRFNPDGTDPVEIVRVPLGYQIEMELKSYSKDDLLMSWSLRDLIEFVNNGLETSYRYDKDLSMDMSLAELFDIYLIADGQQTEGCEI